MLSCDQQHALMVVSRRKGSYVINTELGMNLGSIRPSIDMNIGSFIKKCPIKPRKNPRKNEDGPAER